MPKQPCQSRINESESCAFIILNGQCKKTVLEIRDALPTGWNDVRIVDQVKDRNGMRIYRCLLVRNYEDALHWREVLKGRYARNRTDAMRSFAGIMAEYQAAGCWGMRCQSLEDWSLDITDRQHHMR